MIYHMYDKNDVVIIFWITCIVYMYLAGDMYIQKYSNAILAEQRQRLDLCIILFNTACGNLDM